MTHYFKYLALIFISIVLASCATKQGYSPDAVNDAEQLYLSKQYNEAALAFNQQARGAAGTTQVILKLRAVIAFVKANQLTQAVQLFDSIRINENDLKQTDLARLTRAHIALAERNAEEVLAQLNEPLSIGSPSLFLAEFHELRASAFSMQGERITTAEEYIMQGNYLSNKESIIQSQQLIWESLALLSERALQQMQPAQAPDILSGWMELVRLSKKYQLNPTLLRASITNWQRRYTDHPVDLSLLQGLRNRKQEDVTLPKKIALLLPLSGRFANAARAIRDGLLASYYAKKDKENITIRVYDTKGKTENIEEVYEKAVSDGAQFIIGPLNKASINKLAEQDELSVPTLALNYINPESTPPQELFQFGLSPEEEARQVAERTWLDGHVNAAVLTPAGPWGDRVYKAFRERWQELGGRVVEHQSYNSSKNDFSAPIRKLFNIDDSKRRYRKMSRLLKTKLKYSTYRRQDIDFIFIAGYPRQARQIRPQLKFFHASRVPVYATSHIFTGNLNPERDRDMDGIRFGDMPWVLSETTPHRGLRNEIESLISKAGNKHQRLYAMGVDAFNIIAALNTLKTYPYERYQGETGSLSLDEKQRVKRQLSWVYFRSGRPILLEQASQ
ncbi:MAG: penicillin-binding protein activator [Gammaproteobacteria bacterium]|nr:MAG: penicillin-binding protein activator [Gammaproteobacteria bacterium]